MAPNDLSGQAMYTPSEMVARTVQPSRSVFGSASLPEHKLLVLTGYVHQCGHASLKHSYFKAKSTGTGCMPDMA
jgi:hypothetical protein